MKFMFRKEPFKGYKKLRNDFLKWAKFWRLDTLQAIYNPADDDFMRAFKIEWDKDSKCEGIKLKLLSHRLIQKDKPILTGKDSTLEDDSGVAFGEISNLDGRLLTWWDQKSYGNLI